MGHGNMVADILNQATTQLDPETVKSILNGVALGMMHCAKSMTQLWWKVTNTWNKKYMSLPNGGDTCY